MAKRLVSPGCCYCSERGVGENSARTLARVLRSRGRSGFSKEPYQRELKGTHNHNWPSLFDFIYVPDWSSTNIMCPPLKSCIPPARTHTPMSVISRSVVFYLWLQHHLALTRHSKWIYCQIHCIKIRLGNQWRLFLFIIYVSPSHRNKEFNRYNNRHRY